MKNDWFLRATTFKEEKNADVIGEDQKLDIYCRKKAKDSSSIRDLLMKEIFQQRQQ